VQPPGIVTQKLLRKNTIFVNISNKTEVFLKIYWGVDLGPRYYGFREKTKVVENLMLLSL